MESRVARVGDELFKISCRRQSRGVLGSGSRGMISCGTTILVNEMNGRERTSRERWLLAEDPLAYSLALLEVVQKEIFTGVVN